MQRLARDAKVADDLHAFRVHQFDAHTRLFKTPPPRTGVTRRPPRDGRALAGVEKVRSQKREAGNDRSLIEKNYLRDAQQHRKALAQIDQELEANSFRTASTRGKILKLRSEEKLKELEAETNEYTARVEYDLARQKADLTRHPLNRRTVDEVARGSSAVVGRIVVAVPVSGRVGTVKILRHGEAVDGPDADDAAPGWPAHSGNPCRQQGCGAGETRPDGQAQARCLPVRRVRLGEGGVDQCAARRRERGQPGRLVLPGHGSPERTGGAQHCAPVGCWRA